MAKDPIVNTGTIEGGVITPTEPSTEVHNCDVVNQFVTEAGNGSTITSTEYASGYIQTVVEKDGVASVLECTRLEEQNLGNTPELINEVQPFNGKQNQAEYSLLKEMPDQKVYDDVEHEPTSFKLDTEELVLPVGGQHKFIITVDAAFNYPNLIWLVGRDTKGYSCCHVNDNILYADRVSEGQFEVKAVDITNPKSIVNPKDNMKVIKVTVVNSLVKETPAPEAQDQNGDKATDDESQQG